MRAGEKKQRRSSRYRRITTEREGMTLLEREGMTLLDGENGNCDSLQLVFGTEDLQMHRGQLPAITLRGNISHSCRRISLHFELCLEVFRWICRFVDITLANIQC